MKKNIYLVFFILLGFSAYSQNKFKLNPSIEIGIAQRSNPFELSKYSYLQTNLGTTYDYNSGKHFRNFSLSLALQQFVLKKE